MLDPKYAGKSILSGAEINKTYGVITTVSRQILCGSEALSPVASIILQIPPTSAASVQLVLVWEHTHQSTQQADQYKGLKIGVHPGKFEAF